MPNNSGYYLIQLETRITNGSGGCLINTTRLKPEYVSHELESRPACTTNCFINHWPEAPESLGSLSQFFRKAMMSTFNCGAAWKLIEVTDDSHRTLSGDTREVREQAHIRAGESR